jgi:hypothetical protein
MPSVPQSYAYLDRYPELKLLLKMQITKARELFNFAVEYLTSKSCYHWDFSNYASTVKGKFISLWYYKNTDTISISLLDNSMANRSAVLEVGDRSQITTVLDMLLFAITTDS